jgi:uncharacterized protein YyaL (SSP411 family)
LSVANASESSFSKDLLESAYKGMVSNYDSVNGGFGGAPKFPPAMALEFLMRTYDRTGKEEALEIVSHTCQKMASGGIYDQLGGGFHRYSTDAKWLVPHFEKMLYDNALLSRMYLHYYQSTQEAFARNIAEGILDYVLREMTDPAGGFYSTQDADSEGHEGKFFVWDIAEINTALSERDASLFCDYYNITKAGNFEGKNILHVTSSLEEVAAAANIAITELQETLSRSARKLFELRETRVKPDRDEKILTAWNGLMLASFSEAGAILNRPDYTAAARRNAEFVLTNLRRDGLLLRTYKDGIAKFNGYLEDYAFLIDGLLTLYETSGEQRWFNEARSLTDRTIEEFWDQETGGFYFTGRSHEDLIVRSKDYFDNATPSGNSVAAGVLLRLSLLTDNEDFRNRAITIFRQIADSIRRYPSGFGNALCAIDFHLSTPKEIAIVGADKPSVHDFLSEVWRNYLPNKIVAPTLVDDAEAATAIPLLRNRHLTGRRVTAYVCEHYTCKEPVNDDVGQLAAQLSKA